MSNGSSWCRWGLTDGLSRFNALPTEDAESRLLGCLASARWADSLAGGRPYPDVEALLTAAEVAWSDLDKTEWGAAMAAHPRIGESGGHAPADSEREQSRVRQGSDPTLTALAAENRLYEKRFGHVFLIAAAGRGADEILAALRSRMKNDPAVEAGIAAGELRKIARMRLERVVEE